MIATETTVPARCWSAYQLAIFRDVAEGHGHTVVRARAGSGKTSTIMEALTHVPSGLKVLLVAFNKSIATELQARAPRGVDVSTLHSFGLKAVNHAFGRLQLSQNKVDGLVSEIHGTDRATWEWRCTIKKIVSLAKGCLAHTAEAVDALIDAQGVDVDFEGGPTRADIVATVVRILERCKLAREDGTMDFDDMIWLPIVLDLNVLQFDRVFVDETQDLNPAQIELALRAVKKDGRICAVGDDRQSIYQFRGADRQALPNVIERLKAKVMPLSVTYRCAKAIVQVAQEYVADFEWAPDAIEGLVNETTTEKQMISLAAPGDFILSRSNAPLIGLCLGFLREGRKANIQGRDIGAQLTSFVKKSNVAKVSAFVEHVEKWAAEEIARLVKKNRDTQATEDKAATLIALAEGAQSVNEILARIEALFSDATNENSIILSTTHKAKGLERDRVFVLRHTYLRRSEVEEENLYYVAVTRARKELHIVWGGGES